MKSLFLFNLFWVTLLVVPELSKGQTVKIEVPAYAAVGKELRINCSYSGLDIATMEVTARKRISLSYIETSKDGNMVFKLTTESDIPGLKYEIEKGSTKRKGKVTFIFNETTCGDYRRYVCIVNTVNLDAGNLLKVASEIESITTNSTNVIVDKSYTFTCKGTTPLLGPKTVVRWYRGKKTNEIFPSEQPKEIETKKCTRTIESHLSYKVEESDKPSLKLICLFQNVQTVEHVENFTVKEKVLMPPTTTTLKPDPKPDCTSEPKPDCKSDPKPDCRPNPHYPNSASSNKTKTLLMAFNCILYFLIFSSF